MRFQIGVSTESGDRLIVFDDKLSKGDVDSIIEQMTAELILDNKRV